MKKLVVTVLVLAVSLLAFAGVAAAERGDIGGVGVSSVGVKKLK
ncbi:MAG TPA: hypothetical protein VD969_27405 [Symbiobacteriaceae bacterium]|nr:hypothetical protein [Symbiobacteriaceae bacterium]